MEPPKTILAARKRARLHLTLAVDAIEPVETGRVLDTCRVAGRIVAVHRGKAQVGASVQLRLPCWDASRDRPEPPGPSRLHYNAAMPAALDVWGRLDGDVLNAVSFEAVAEALEIVDRLAARLSHLPRRDASAVETAMIGAGAGLALKEAGRGGLVVFTVRPEPCVQSATIMARYGPEHRFEPPHPERPLPAPWYLSFEREWGMLHFAIEMTEPHNLDGCLVEVILDFSGRR